MLAGHFPSQDKGLDEMKSYFWQVVLKMWIENNRVDSTSSGCTVSWNNRNVTCQGQVLYLKDWIKAGIMNVADTMTPKAIASYKDLCKRIGEAPNRVLQYSVVPAAFHDFLRDFDNEALNDELTDVPLFLGQKIYTVSKFRQKTVEKKKAEPCSIGFWKRKFNFTVGKTHTWLLSYRCTQETRLRVLW